MDIDARNLRYKRPKAQLDLNWVSSCIQAAFSLVSLPAALPVALFGVALALCVLGGMRKSL